MKHADALQPLRLIRHSCVSTGEKIAVEEVFKVGEIYAVVLDVLLALGIIPCVHALQCICETHMRQGAS